MSSSSRSTTVWTVAGVTLLTGFLAYAVYFDNKRRNDPDFRKKLRKDKKRVNKALAQSKDASSASAASEITPEALRVALEQVKNEDGPKSPEEREGYFMSQVGMSEQLSLQGPAFHLPAAVCFFKALRVYPAPVELIMIYQKTVPEPIFKVRLRFSIDKGYEPNFASLYSGYYERFPLKSFNVAIEERPRPGHPASKVVVLTQDVAAGETIYKEYPIVTALDPDVQSAGTHCTHCFRTIQPKLSLVLPLDADPLHSRFCSQACLVANKAQSHTILFSQDSPIPEELSVPIPIPEESKQARREAQDKYMAYLKKEGRTAPLLAARFIARQLAAETLKVAGGGKARKLPGVEHDYMDTDDTEYVLADHLERLKALDLDSVQPDEEELTLLVEVLKAGFPGLDEFVNDERYALMIAKMRFNSYGVCFDGGRDDRPVQTVPVEEMERTRTPYGTSRQIGSALY
ncbi:MAS20-domain-containing protein, partial [Pluteus cervinus]